MGDRTITWLLLSSSLLTASLLAYAAYDENFGADWYRYQSEYRRRLLARATTELQHRAAQRYEIRQKQLYLPDLDRIDRCVTCHVAIDDPVMKDAPQPLTSHPGDTLVNHPKERFGCTICHQGQGLASTALDAHGRVSNWLEPMLTSQLIEQTCAKCHMERSLPGVARYNAAMELFHAKACISCHKLRGQGGDKGPDITRAGELHDADWHFKHFKDPKSVVATSQMPDMNFTDEEATILTDLMMSYTGESIPTDFLSNPKHQPVELEFTQTVDPVAAEGYLGSRVCIRCHEAMHATAVEGWRVSKMTTTYERIKDEPIKDNCLACHTTGVDPETGHYMEEGVGCEGCHGPGRESVLAMLAGNMAAHKQAMELDPNSTLVCSRCHNPHVPVGTHAEYYRRQPRRFSSPDAGDTPQPPATDGNAVTPDR